LLLFRDSDWFTATTSVLAEAKAEILNEQLACSICAPEIFRSLSRLASSLQPRVELKEIPSTTALFLKNPSSSSSDLYLNGLVLSNCLLTTSTFLRFGRGLSIFNKNYKKEKRMMITDNDNDADTSNCADEEDDFDYDVHSYGEDDFSSSPCSFADLSTADDDDEDDYDDHGISFSFETPKNYEKLSFLSDELSMAMIPVTQTIDLATSPGEQDFNFYFSGQESCCFLLSALLLLMMKQSHSMKILLKLESVDKTSPLLFFPSDWNLFLNTFIAVVIMMIFGDEDRFKFFLY
jgi:hypothetical protein